MSLFVACFVCLVLTCPTSWAKPQPQNEIRTYYVAADEVDWDYGPDGVNKMMGMNFDGI